MRHGSGFWLSTGASLLLACNGQEIPVFELPSASGSAGTAGTTAAAGGDTGGSSTAEAGAAGAASVAGGGTSGAAGAAGSGGAGGMAGAAGMPATPCASRADCMPGWRCEKPRCTEPMGECSPPPPVFCEPEPLPVCGCDGVTYWNDCIRRQTGAQLQATGECSATAFACEVGADCEMPFASCAHLVQGGETCHSSSTGACWVLPPRCMPNAADAPTWQECRPPDVPPGPCVDTCLAIASERRHTRKKPGDVCQF